MRAVEKNLERPQPRIVTIPCMSNAAAARPDEALSSSVVSSIDKALLDCGYPPFDSEALAKVRAQRLVFEELATSDLKQLEAVKSLSPTDLAMFFVVSIDKGDAVRLANGEGEQPWTIVLRAFSVRPQTGEKIVERTFPPKRVIAATRALAESIALPMVSEQLMAELIQATTPRESSVRLTITGISGPELLMVHKAVKKLDGVKTDSVVEPTFNNGVGEIRFRTGRSLLEIGAALEAESFDGRFELAMETSAADEIQMRRK
jgi:hypothetical protein